jgi:hypothetical protein
MNLNAILEDIKMLHLKSRRKSLILFHLLKCVWE